MKKILTALVIMVSLVHAVELNTSMKEYMKTLETQAQKENPKFKGFDYIRGEKIFTTKYIGKKGKLISCVSCHSSDLSKKGINVNTNKVIEPLSPLADSSRFTKVKNVKKWLRRNFRDVYNRVGTAQEKGDVVTYIINKK
ncbi:MAG: DUF1924 domain-containing protein [Arcobacteraceae bacterium]|nr:DUF1924 domain-containing protein [Arcobacteraceae bacterium]